MNKTLTGESGYLLAVIGKINESAAPIAAIIPAKMITP
jgi:hypothetical protein